LGLLLSSGHSDASPARFAGAANLGRTAAMGSFLYFIVQSLLTMLIWAIIISAIISWLVAFDVINLRNRFVYNVSRFLDAVTRPVLRPVQRFIPPLGGVDISPIIVIVVLQGASNYLLPLIFRPLVATLG
jgi:YggT family protein